ncbi:MAG: hypothetical protein AB1609_07175 [Bacillota bacterium]
MQRVGGSWIGPVLGVVSLLLVAGAGAVEAAVPDSLFAEGVELRTSARVAGMGGAFVGLADDGATLFYNPGGLAFLPRFELQGAGISGPELSSQPAEGTSTRLSALAAARGFGMGATRMTLPSETGEAEGLKGSVGLAIPLGFIGLGVTGNYLVDKGGDPGKGGKGWIADAGALVSLGPLRLGAVWRGVAGEVTLLDGKDTPLDPASYRQTIYGAALRLGFANIAVDYALPAGWWGPDVAPHVRAGAELTLGPLTLRGGVSRHQPEGTRLNPEMHTLGASLNLGPLRLDYALAEPWSEGDPFWGGNEAKRVQSLGLRLAF